MRRRNVLAGAVGVGLLPFARALAADPNEITIPIASSAFAASGLRAAKALGLFEKNGLAARIVIMDSGNAAMGALISGAVRAAEAGAGELISAQARGQAVVAVADVYRGFSASLVLSRAAAERSGVAPDAPVAQRLKALDGLVVAVPSATSIYTVGFRTSAEAAGAKMRLTYLAQPAMGAALETGAIQGMIAAAPFWMAPVARGAGTLWISGPRGELPPQNTPVSSGALLTLESTARNDPDFVRRLRQVIADLGTAITDRPGEVEEAEARLYPDLDRATLKLLLAAEMRNLRTPKLTVADMAHEIELVRSSGIPVPGLERVDPAKLLPAY